MNVARLYSQLSSNKSSVKIDTNAHGETQFSYITEKNQDGIHVLKNTQLPLESIQRVVDDVVRVQEYAPDIVRDLMDTKQINSIPPSVREAQVEGLALLENANVSMEGDSVSTESGEYTSQYIPMLCTHKDVRMGFRDVEYAAGVKADEAARVVHNTLEKLFLFGTAGTGEASVGFASGLGYKTDGSARQLEGFVNNANTTKDTNFSIPAASATDANLTLYNNITGLLDDKLKLGYSNFNLYFSSEQKNRLSANFTKEYGLTLAGRLEQHPDINKVRYSKYLSKSAVLALSMDARSVACYQSIPMMVLPVPASNTGFSMAVKYITCSVPVLYANIQRGNKLSTVSGAVYGS